MPNPKSTPESKGPQRLVVSVVAAAAGVFIAAEPLLFGATPSMQLFQSALVFGFWVLLMFGGASEHPNGPK
jgi:hypothetical protein